MNRTTLLALQILVAVVSIGFWHVFAKYPICGCPISVSRRTA